MEVKTIGLASDHAGFALKQFVKKYLDEKGYQYKDYGTYTEESCDYSDFGHALAKGIEDGEVFPGIAICGSGEGINMTLNKHQSIRAGLCWIPEIAHLIRQHVGIVVLTDQMGDLRNPAEAGTDALVLVERHVDTLTRSADGDAGIDLTLLNTASQGVAEVAVVAGVLGVGAVVLIDVTLLVEVFLHELF